MDLCYYQNDDQHNEDWSSGCDSGWTLYLDEQQQQQPSTISPWIHHHQFTKLKRTAIHEDDDDDYYEDSSMVSDASSGPPHFHDEDEEIEQEEEDDKYCCHQPPPVKRFRAAENQRLRFNDQSSNLLNDTASSPLLDYSNETRRQALEESQGFSTTQLEKDYGIYKSSSRANYQIQQYQEWLEDKS